LVQLIKSKSRTEVITRIRESSTWIIDDINYRKATHVITLEKLELIVDFEGPEVFAHFFLVIFESIFEKCVSVAALLHMIVYFSFVRPPNAYVQLKLLEFDSGII
jgi:hypothetical protein